VALRVWEYVLPVAPAGSWGGVVITKPDPMVRLNCWVVRSEVLSVTETANVTVPALTGVPLISPVADPSVSPEGSDPEVTSHK
jgi:hypothetical protein